MSGVYVVLEDRGGRIGRISWEALAAGKHPGRTVRREGECNRHRRTD